MAEVTKTRLDTIPHNTEIVSEVDLTDTKVQLSNLLLLTAELLEEVRKIKHGENA